MKSLQAAPLLNFGVRVQSPCSGSATGVVKVGAKSLSPDEAAFVAKIREQIRILRHDEYNYVQLRIFVSGIATPWVFGPDDEFEFDGEAVLVVRVGPTTEYENQGVPERVFPLRHVVATELAIGEE
jgi:hypothetical protein